MITRVADDVYRGPAPTTDADWNVLKGIGIKYCLDLQNGAAFDSSVLAEQFKSKEYGVETFAHPLGQFLPPTKSELTLALNTIDKFKPIYVHCKAGVDRTGMVIAWFEIDKGSAKAQAIGRMKKLGMHFWYYWWSWFL